MSLSIEITINLFNIKDLTVFTNMQNFLNFLLFEYHFNMKSKIIIRIYADINIYK